MTLPSSVDEYTTHRKNKYLTVTTEVGGAATFSTTGHHDSLVMLYNTGHQGATGTWTQALDDGSLICDQNQTAATLIIPLTGLKVGDEITGFRLVGAVGAKAAGTTTVDAVLKKVTKGAGSVTATNGPGSGSVCSITQVSKVADYSMDELCTLGSTVTVATDYQYFIKVTATTADNAENDVFVTGVELLINRRV